MSFEDSESLKDFSSSFFKKTSSTPTSLEVFAHDAVRLASKILSDNLVTGIKEVRSHVRNQIAQFRGRVGLLLDVSFTKDGVLESADFGFVIQNGRASVLQEAANS